MEQINIEEIMNEIRAEIKEKGYKDNDIAFSDITCIVNGTDLPFDKKEYLDDLALMEEKHIVFSYRDINSSKFVTFIKKILRKLMCFYVEPIVDDQNNFNEITTRIAAQNLRRYADEDARIEELEKKLYKCERKIRELEELLKDKQ